MIVEEKHSASDIIIGSIQDKTNKEKKDTQSHQ